MSGTNHVTGGIVFTGIFASFFDLNIFEKPQFLFFTVLFSVLPDSDHTRSPIGKLLFPIAKFIDRRYGHRTITHSLICYIAIYILLRVMEILFNLNHITSLIYLFSYASHLIFDMMTKQGVPLFYPFRRNPCVIPGNPELRLKSNDLRTESVIFVITICLGFICHPLFSNGFWTTYNKSFGTIEHLSREFKVSKNLITVDYDFIDNGQKVTGSGFVLYADNHKTIIFDNNRKFIEINDKYHAVNLNFNQTKQLFNSQTITFNNITTDSINKLLKQKIIINLKLYTTTRLQLDYNNEIKISSNHTLNYAINPIFTETLDTTNNNIIQQIEIVKYELERELQEEKQLQQTKENLTNRINEIKDSIPNMDLYSRERATEELAKLEQKNNSIKQSPTKVTYYQLKLKHLHEKLKEKQVLNKISGEVTFLQLPAF